jgi:hypothetical protein
MEKNRIRDNYLRIRICPEVGQQTKARALTDEDDGEECGVGVHHAGALPPGAAAPEEGHDEDDHSCNKNKN